MSFAMRAAAAAFLLVGTTGIGAAQTEAPAPATSSFDEMVGHKLTAIDGSSIALSPAEGGIAREIVSASGTIQRTYFSFINDKLGTVADASDIRKVTGVFRRVGDGIQIDYADGSTERLAINPGGGLTLQTISAKATACVSWYPEGHTFSLEERKAALAAFAVKLGLADVSSKAPKSDCETPVAATETKPPAATAPAPQTARVITGTVQPAKQTAIAVPVRPATAAIAATAGVAAGAAPALAGSAPTTAAKVADAQSIDVRDSPIHLIDPEPAATDSNPQVLASATPPNALAPDQHGASSCLSVESDGSHWGFRNHCGYTVQFAYCLMGPNQLASCSDGAVAGSVAGNGFGALV